MDGKINWKKWISYVNTYGQYHLRGGQLPEILYN
jgi:hypothetical protein